MWTAGNEKLSGFKGLKFTIELDARPVTFAEVIHGWQSDSAFRLMFNSLLADAPFTAFRWETPAVTTNTTKQPFEFVLLDSPGLARQPDPEVFSAHFERAENGIAVFPNLGRDGIMIAPSPLADISAYGHLAAFVRHAPETQRDALWQSVGLAISKRLGDKPVWLNTAGAGVSWLHVRLDDKPKYYGYEPFTRICIADA